MVVKMLHAKISTFKTTYSTSATLDVLVKHASINSQDCEISLTDTLRLTQTSPFFAQAVKLPARNYKLEIFYASTEIHAHLGEDADIQRKTRPGKRWSTHIRPLLQRALAFLSFPFLSSLAPCASRKTRVAA
ncbi:unnamed protein product [Thelazia callipaeda]|uniref:Wzt_C domain-containing protein n=1 Tax=Thelazia callipaeda TaxID=103827 RepID=A0A0N5CLU3_THECL|nr:unnamed protein product [Thelazia callipaeda]